VELDDLSRWARSDGLQIVLLALGAVLLSRFAHWVAARFNARLEGEALDAAGQGMADAERYTHGRAVIQAIERTVTGLIYFVVAVMVLIRFKVPITTLVAPATLAGVALGFGAQRVVADLLSGFFLVSENQFGPGEVVEVASPGSASGISGTVEAVSLRTTRLRTAKGELVIVANGEIRQVTNRSRDWSQVSVDVPVSMEADLDQVITSLREAVEDMTAEDEWEAVLLQPPAVTGVEAIDVDVLRVRLIARTIPSRASDVARELRHRAALAVHATA
jgi:small-conductance mechanosensitive channel